MSSFQPRVFSCFLRELERASAHLAVLKYTLEMKAVAAMFARDEDEEHHVKEYNMYIDVCYEQYIYIRELARILIHQLDLPGAPI